MELVFKAIVLSLIITASIKVGYGVDNLIILVGVNVVSLVFSYFAMNKISTDKEEEYKKRERKMLGVLTSHLKAINQNIINNTNAVADIIANLEQNINNIIGENLNSLANMEGLNSGIHEIAGTLQDTVRENGVVVDRIISEERKHSNKLVASIENNNKELLNKIEVINEILSSSKESVNEIIEIKHMVKSNSTNVSDICSKLDENISLLIEEKEEIRRFKNEINSLLEETMDSSLENVEVYKDIQNNTLNELSKLAEKNEYIVSLLMDSYKILNLMMSK